VRNRKPPFKWRLLETSLILRVNSSGYSKSVKRRTKYAIVSAVYRKRDEDYDATMNIVSGLVN
jgi:hypothetical protein